MLLPFRALPALVFLTGCGRDVPLVLRDRMFGDGATDGSMPGDTGSPSDGGFTPGPDAGGPDAGIPTVVGAACGVTEACPGGQCIEEAAGFPGGYCSQACGPGEAPCPSGAACRDVGFELPLCFDTCETTAACRSGYRCVQLGATSGRVCWPFVSGSTNPGGRSVGSACAVDDDCVQGTQCRQAGWPGGYCTVMFCDVVSRPCPSGSSCFAFPGSTSMCLANCPRGGSQSTCRAGYFCFGLNGLPGGCIPN